MVRQQHPTLQSMVSFGASFVFVKVFKELIEGYLPEEWIHEVRYLGIDCDDSADKFYTVEAVGLKDRETVALLDRIDDIIHSRSNKEITTRLTYNNNNNINSNNNYNHISGIWSDLYEMDMVSLIHNLKKFYLNIDIRVLVVILILLLFGPVVLSLYHDYKGNAADAAVLSPGTPVLRVVPDDKVDLKLSNMNCAGSSSDEENSGSSLQKLDKFTGETFPKDTETINTSIMEDLKLQYISSSETGIVIEDDESGDIKSQSGSPLIIYGSDSIVPTAREEEHLDQERAQDQEQEQEQEQEQKDVPEQTNEIEINITNLPEPDSKIEIQTIKPVVSSPQKQQEKENENENEQQDNESELAASFTSSKLKSSSRRISTINPTHHIQISPTKTIKLDAQVNTEQAYSQPFTY
ncbi:hypothetical protein Kpol_1067p19 [Vanderwaltozyma polyspora DSM 70294]|uniref:Uncharacterized protein n=1 Tax=Vanderwaltozyma polyspora (strain ATCC 22028 / DSM 70294 / BCRC 21397 / CBS 2163 / NBRC 10782 / NRRL Y-8283 / UCD 57-17) TaxID=436907 RepID=A7TNW4_VANPO|nr:uncharacterized protein Kpol_1067p19 [Vanderwaltozyma polyspora DSM 70294]EDO16047.1 hypothetical protein Kpol_1067p19 [Vanderwaltozyma polyspora DSM 70294]